MVKPCLYQKIQKNTKINLAQWCTPVVTATGGWGGRITWIQEVEVTVSPDHATTFQPGQEWDPVSNIYIYIIKLKCFESACRNNKMRELSVKISCESIGIWIILNPLVFSCHCIQQAKYLNRVKIRTSFYQVKNKYVGHYLILHHTTDYLNVNNS